MSFHFHIPTSIYFGAEWWRKLPSLLTEDGSNPEAVLVLASPRALKQQVENMTIADLFDHSRLTIFDRITPLPSPRDVEQVKELALAKRVTAIIAIGGGSTLDLAKAAALSIANPNVAIDRLTTASDIETSLPVAAIPTTSGSGADVTPWASLWLNNRTGKISISHPGLFPKISLSIPELTLSKPPALTASSGLDAICQAIESYWSRQRQIVSQSLALRAIRLIRTALPTAVRDSDDLGARCDMAKASLMAGLAFSNTRTTICHALSYRLTGHHRFPHGFACFLTIREALKRNLPALAADETKLLLDALGSDTADGACENLTRLGIDVGAPLTLKDAGIDYSDDLVPNSLDAERSGNNPVPITTDEARAMLRAIAQ